MSTSKKIIKTKDFAEMGKETQEFGDDLLTQYYKTKDLKVGQTSLAAYKVAISCAKLELVNKKLTGKPAKVRGLS